MLCVRKNQVVNGLFVVILPYFCCYTVVVDVSEPDTVGLAPTWKQDVLNHAQFTEAHSIGDDIMVSSIPVLLLGNKLDKLEVYPLTNADL